MIQLKKVLIPVDFSEASKRALTYGITLAVQLNAKPLLAHIITDKPPLSYGLPTEATEAEDSRYESAHRDIQALVPERYAKQFDIKMIVKSGNIEKELLGIVEQESVDWIVMGTHGRQGIQRWLLGSVTEHMLRKSSVPVMTVSHVDSDSHCIELGLVAVKRILYAPDLSEACGGGMKYAIELALATAAQLTVLHAVNNLEFISLGGAFTGHLQEEKLKFVLETDTRLNEFIARATPAGMKVERLVVEGLPYETILQVAKDQNTDLIVLNLQKKSRLEPGFMGSTAERVVRMSPIPVFSVPASEE